MTSSSPAVRLISPAKINLFLEIRRRREDGYHEINTLFQEISLCDRLDARVCRKGGVRLTSDSPGLPVDDKNLVFRATRAYQEKFPEAPGFVFRLTKRIPVGAGLGGGSGNAATALLACRTLTPPRVSRESARDPLLPLAKKIGADVPFFLRGGLAAAGGVGDRLTFYSPTLRRKYFFVLIFPRLFSSTPEAYRALQFPLTKRRSRLKLTRALRDGALPNLWAPWLFNRLEEVVLPRFKAVALAKRALIQAGCLNALMSGSGSSVFGVVENADQGHRVLARLKREPWDSWLVTSASCRTKGSTNFDEVGQYANHRNPGFAPGGRQT